jgi:hypothetical protein
MGLPAAAAAAVPAVISAGRALLPYLPGVSSVVQSARSNLPQLEDECTVTVVGNPKAKRKELYFLAASVAFGIVRRFDLNQWAAPPPGMILLEYGLSNNSDMGTWVRFTVRYKTSLLSAAAAALRTPFLNGFFTGFGSTGSVTGGIVQGVIDAFNPEKPLPMYKDVALYAGPKDEVIGGEWGFTGRLVPGIPSNAKSVGSPQLQFAGKTILTHDSVCRDPDPSLVAGSEPVVAAGNPRPPGDFRSRGTLQSLVFAALSDPGSENGMTFPLPTAANAFTGG